MMAVKLLDEIPGYELPEEWQALVREQASTLAVLLARIETAAVLLRQRQAAPAQWQALAAEAERLLTAQAQQHVSLERELVELRALVMDFSTRPSALVTRVQTLERALAVLHVNVAATRQYLTTVFAQER